MSYTGTTGTITGSSKLLGMLETEDLGLAVTRQLETVAERSQCWAAWAARLVRLL